MHRRLLHILLLGLVLMAPSLTQSAEQGWFGIAFRVATRSETDLVIVEVLVKDVVPNSPAAGKVKVGDTLVSVDGRDVLGLSTEQLKTVLYHQVGQSATVRMKDAKGVIYSVTMKAVPRPK